MIKASGCVPQSQCRSPYAGVSAWCGAEHKRDPKRDCIVETQGPPTCLSRIARKLWHLSD